MGVSVEEDGRHISISFSVHVHIFSIQTRILPFHVTTHARDVATQDRYGVSDSPESTVCGKIRNLTFDGIVTPRAKSIPRKYC